MNKFPTVLFLLYCTLRELARFPGSNRMRAPFLGPRLPGEGQRPKSAEFTAASRKRP